VVDADSVSVDAGAVTPTGAVAALTVDQDRQLTVTVYVYVPAGTEVSSQLLAAPDSGALPVPHAGAGMMPSHRVTV
jgi:hypothetical protein